MKLLQEDYKNNGSEWENDSLELFLEALYGYNYNSKTDEKPSWREFAENLLAAKVYE
ncbi:MAG: hypothetical protein AAGC64_13435 [Bacteroidota bacterium]